MIDTAEELDDTVGAVAHEVTGFVYAGCSVCAKGILNKAFDRQFRAVHVTAGYLGAADPQLTWAGVSFPPSYDLGGLWGRVSLVSSPSPYLDSIQTTPGSDLASVNLRCVIAHSGRPGQANLTCRILAGDGTVVAQDKRTIACDVGVSVSD